MQINILFYLTILIFKASRCTWQKLAAHGLRTAGLRDIMPVLYSRPEVTPLQNRPMPLGSCQHRGTIILQGMVGEAVTKIQPH
jgi:hypothetical protein